MTRDDVTAANEYRAFATQAARTGHEIRLTNEEIETVGGQEGREVDAICPHCLNRLAHLRWQVLGQRYTVEDLYSRFSCTQERTR